MRRAKIIGRAKGKHFQRKESNSKLFIFVVLTMMITIMAFIRVEQTMAKYVMRKETSLSITTSNFHFLAEADETEFNTIGEITSNISTKNFESNEYTNTDIAYTTTATNNHYDITIQNGTATLTGEQNSTGTITIVATPKENVELSDTETIVVTITSSKPYVDTRTINLVVDTKFTVTYEYNNATEGNTETSKRVKYNRAYGTLPNPGREYTTQFNTNGGTSLESQTVSHTFDGWYKDALFNTLINAETIVTDAFAHNIYAKWTLSSIRLGQTTKSGYTFDGWYLNSGFTGDRYDAGDTYTPVSNETMFAKWNLNTYTINYTLNGGTVQNANPTTYTVESSDITLNNPTKTGYTFLGWTGSNGNVEDTSVTISHGSTGDKTYTANWAINFSRLTIDPAGGRVDVTGAGEQNPTTINTATTYQQNYNTVLTVGTPVKDDNVDTSTTYTITYNGNGGSVNKNSNIATRTIITGYLFDDWVKSTPFYGSLQDSRYTYSSMNNVQSTITATYTSSIKSNTVESVTTANATRQYTVTYNHNYEGSSNTTRTSTYTMNGWYTASTGGTKRADNGGIYTPTGTETLYAQWTSASVTYVPTREHYDFAGWYTDSACTNSATGVNGIYTPESNITLFAKWEEEKHTVTYNYSTNGGTSTTKSSDLVRNGEAVDLTPTAKKTGWTFVGWNTNSAATSKLTSLTMGNEDITLYAIFKKTVYAYFYEGSSSTTTDYTTKAATMYSSSASVLLPSSVSLVPSSYTFVGWSTSTATGTTNIYSPGTTRSISANTSYYAIYRREYTATFRYYTEIEPTKTIVTDTLPIYRQMNAAFTTSSYEAIPLTLPSYSNTTGWTFLGWSTSSSATGTYTSSGVAVQPTSNTNYYARYSKDVTCTFDYYNGNSNIIENVTGQRNATAYSSGTISNPTITSPTITQYNEGDGVWNVIGWSLSREPGNSTAKDLSSGGSISGATEDAYYCARYRKSVKFTFNYYATTTTTNDSGGTTTTHGNSYASRSGYKYANSWSIGNVNYPTATVPTASNLNGSSTTLHTTYNTFLYWTDDTTPDGTSVYTGGETITLYYDEVYYAVQRHKSGVKARFYDINGTTASHLNTEITVYPRINAYAPSVLLGENVTVPSAATCTNWTYVGWKIGNSGYNTEAGTTPAYYVGDQVEITAATSFYAIYERPITLIYNLNGGTGNIPNVTVYRRILANRSPTSSYVYTPPITITSATPTKSGKTFNGWNTSASSPSGNSNYAAGKNYAIPYNKTEFTLYAIYK